MWDLRWVLAGLGVLLVLGVYLASKGLFRRQIDRAAVRGRHEPVLDGPDSVASAVEELEASVELDEFEELAEFEALEKPPELEEPLEPEDDDLAPEAAADGAAKSERGLAIRASRTGSHATAARRSKEPPKAAQSAVDRVIALRLVPKTGNEIPADAAVLALRALGLQHGRYGIFHWLDEAGRTHYSVASLTEPGSFDLTRLAESTVAGLSIFMVLPGPGDPVERFDEMIAAARSLTQRLEADLLDERGSSWSIQRERYIREEIIEYRYQLEHA